VVIDFKGDSKDYDCFAGWPNVHLLTQEFHANLRALLYVKELMDSRFKNIDPPPGAPPSDAPVLMIVDELASAVDELTHAWKRWKTKDLPPDPIPLAALRQIVRKGRSQRIHVFSATQRATAEYFSGELKLNSQFQLQIGNVDGTTSQNFWGDYDIGSTVQTDTRGRALTKDSTGFRQFQVFYTPTNPASIEDAEILADLCPTTALYDRLMINLPYEDEIATWAELRHAHLFADRPPSQHRVTADVSKSVSHTPQNPGYVSKSEAVTTGCDNPPKPAVISTHNAGEAPTTPAAAVTACDNPAGVCSGPHCHNLLDIGTAARYCSGACRQRASRARRR
jgi:hypothetical protein